MPRSYDLNPVKITHHPTQRIDTAIGKLPPFDIQQIVDGFLTALKDLTGIDLTGIRDFLENLFGSIDWSNLPDAGEVWAAVVSIFIRPLNIFAIPAEVQASINAALGDVQDALNGTYAGSDPVLLAVKALAEAWLKVTDPLNAGNLFGRIALPQFGSGVPIMALTTAVPNELEPFSATSVPTADGWSFNATEDAAQLICDGSPKALYLKSGVIKVEEGQPLDTSIDVEYSGIVSGAGQTIRYVLDTFTTDDGSGTATPVIVGAVTNPTGTITTPVTLGDSSWDIPAGVKSVRPVLEGDELITAGIVYWKNTPELYKKLAGPLSEGLPKAIQDRIDDMQATWNAFKGGVGGTVADIQDALDDAGQAIRDALANALGHAGTGHTSANLLTYFANIPQNVIDGLGDALDEAGQDIRDAIVNAITGGSGTGHTSGDVITALTNIPRDLVDGLEDELADLGDGVADVFDDVRDGWNHFWDGIFGGSGSTGKTAEDVKAAAASVTVTATDAVNAAQTATALATYAGGRALWESANGSIDATMLESSLGTGSTPLNFAVTSTASAMGFVRTRVATDKSIVQWFGRDNSLTTAKLHTYRMDPTTGDLTWLQTKDIVPASLPNAAAFGRVIIELDTPVHMEPGEVLAFELCVTGGTHNIAGLTVPWLTPDGSAIPKGAGASRNSGSESSAPTTILADDIPYGTKIPYMGAGVPQGELPPPAYTYYFTDTFNSFGSWSAVGSANWQIVSGTVLNHSPNPSFLIYANSTYSDKVKALFTMAEVIGRNGIAFSENAFIRYYIHLNAACTNGVAIEFQSNGASQPATVRLISLVGGVRTVRDTSATTRADGSMGTYAIEYDPATKTYTAYSTAAGADPMTWTDSGDLIQHGPDYRRSGVFSDFDSMGVLATNRAVSGVCGNFTIYDVA